jgi:predicted RecB family nuclease
VANPGKGAGDELTLNKREILSGIRCQKLLWWMRNEDHPPELALSAETRVRMSEGQRADEHARLFMGASGPDRLFQPSYSAAGATIRADALERQGDRWTLVEVKSSKSPRDKKDRKRKVEEHQLDVAVQAAVIRASGTDVDRSHLMLLNRDFVHPDHGDLFVREDITAEVDADAAKVLPVVDELRRVVRGPLPTVPIGDQCTDPEECPFYKRCHDELPDHHVSELYYAKRHAAKFEASGKTLISHLSEDDAPNEAAKRQVRSVKAGKRIVESGLRAALDNLAQPIAFLDFETVQLAVPRWAGCRPQDLVAVQFSVHREGFADDTPREFLAERGDDPRAPMIEPLIEACAGARTVLVYYEPFEKARLEELAEWFPKSRKPLLDIHARVVDLLPIVRENVYDPEFRGSFSLKKVLPALVPDLDYKDLNIREGGSATAAIYKLLFDESLDPDTARALRTDLLAYCRRDTEAMVRLLQVLRTIAG